MSTYDAIIVGARAAGAATALGLARRGHRVLVLERDRRGTDTLSTHALQRTAVVLLEHWGLVDRLRDLGTPAIDAVTFHYAGDEPYRIDLRAPLYAPRRTVLDPVLSDAAAAAGAEIRWRTRVDHLLRSDDGRVRGVRATGPDGRAHDLFADIVIGADGRNSAVAREVRAPVTWQGTAAGTYFYAHVCGIDAVGYHWLFGEGTSAGVVPTNDGTATVFVGASADRFDELRRDPAASFDTILRGLSPDIAAWIATGHRAGPVRGFPGCPGRLRRPWGPGWALVGDAGSFKDPISSHGITDALKDAELLADALDGAARGHQSIEAALSTYEATRDAFTLPLVRAVEPVATYGLPVGRLREHHLAQSDAMQDEASAFRAMVAGPSPVNHALVAA